MKINAIQLNTKYNQVQFKGNNNPNGAMLPTQTPDSTQFKRNLDTSMANTEASKTKVLTKVLRFFNPKADNEPFTDEDLYKLVSQRMSYL
jgi:hypothetical protein